MTWLTLQVLLGFSMVKIHYFQKVLKNGLVSEKKYFISFLGGGQTPKWKTFQKMINVLLAFSI